MIKINLTVSNIPKDRIIQGQKGKYLDLVLFENKNGPDKFGNDGFVSIDVTKDERLAGKKGEIVGNWKHVGGGKKQAPKNDTYDGDF
jgi:hypothetical protein